MGSSRQRWLEVKSSTVEATTLASYRWIATTYLRPRLGTTPPDKIRALDLDTMYFRLRAVGGRDGRALPPRTVRYCHTVVTQVLDQARRWGIVARNVAADATVPRSKLVELIGNALDAEADELSASNVVSRRRRCRASSGRAARRR